MLGPVEPLKNFLSLEMKSMDEGDRMRLRDQLGRQWKTLCIKFVRARIQSGGGVNGKETEFKRMGCSHHHP